MFEIFKHFVDLYTFLCKNLNCCTFLNDLRLVTSADLRSYFCGTAVYFSRRSLNGLQTCFNIPQKILKVQFKYSISQNQHNLHLSNTAYITQPNKMYTYLMVT